METSNKVKRIAEISQASVLKAMGIPYLGVEVVEGGRVVIIFDNAGDKAEEILIKHCNGDLDVNSERFIAAQNFVKDLIFGTRRANGGDHRGGSRPFDNPIHPPRLAAKAEGR